MVIRPFLFAVLALCLAQRVVAADLDEAREAITVGWAKHESMRATVNMTSNIPIGEARLELRGEGQEVYQKGEDRPRYRVMLTLLPPDPVLQQFRLDVRYDGEKVYTTNEARGATTEEGALGEGNGIAAPGGDLLLEQIDVQHSLSRLEDAAVQGRDAYVLEAVPDGESASSLPYVRALFYVDQETGALLKRELFESPGVVTTTFLYSVFEWDVELEDDTFKPVK